jgi:YrbI family 3-deoxy-D-manno-octulosonate 8-phosphate phosphatase
VAIITGRASRALTLRTDELGIDLVRQGVGNKLAAAAEVIGTCGLSWEESAFVGDDLPDLPVVRKCGVGVAVADACPELRAAAVLVTERVGGRGAVREVVERLLRARGEWEAAVAGYRGGVA